MTSEVLPKLQQNEGSSSVSYDRFEELALDLLASRVWEPDTEDTLLQAFKALDEENTGFIEATRLRELLLTKGTPFRDKEIDSFLQVAKDPDTGLVYFEDYISLMCTDSEN